MELMEKSMHTESGVRTPVVMFNGEVRAGTWLIAKGFGRGHTSITKLINRNIKEFEYFGDLKSSKCTSTGGRPVVEYMLNEEQALLLGTYLRNSEVVKRFKRLLIKKFSEQKELLLELQYQQKTPAWVDARIEGKAVRLEATSIIQQFTKYAEEQGSPHPQMYYASLTKMMNGLLFIVRGKYKNLRDVLTTRQLMTVSSAEQIIERALIEGMKKRTYHKDIYSLAKSRVYTFAELHGQSEVIQKSLGVEDTPPLLKRLGH